MPDPRKVHWSQLKIGVVALAAFTVVFVLVFLLTSSQGSIFQRSQLLLTYMNQASGIADGSVVRLNGYTIGYLDTLRLTDSSNPKRAVEFRMIVSGKFLSQIPVDSVAEITAATCWATNSSISRGARTPAPSIPGTKLEASRARTSPN